MDKFCGNCLSIFLLIVSIIETVTGCPTGCMCHRDVTRCTQLNLTTIPSNIPAGTRVLDLRYNKIKQLHRYSFRHLESLHTLLINNNQIRTVEHGTFKYVPHLQNLYMYHNQIKSIDYPSFRGLRHLETLYLHHNQISEITPNSFNDLKSLRHLYLNENRLQTITKELFANLDSLMRVRLDQNPFHCNCTLRGLAEFLVEHRIEGSSKASCNNPQRLRDVHLADVDWQSVCTTDNSLQSIQANPPEEDYGREQSLPTIIKSPSDTSASLGDSVVFDCRAQGRPPPIIEWVHNDRLVFPSATVTVHSNGQLSLTDIVAVNAGEYTCRARNRVGQVTASARLRIVRPADPAQTRPTFIINPVDTVVPEGGTAKFICQAQGNPEPSITWRFGDKVLTPSRRFTFVRKDSELSIYPVLSQDIGQYSCTASNSVSSISTTFQLKSRVSSPPKFTHVPKNVQVTAGNQAKFECSATGEPRPRIVWYFNGSPLPTVRGHYNVHVDGKMTITVATKDDQGSYTCQAMNSVGSVATDAELTVDSNPSVDNAATITDEFIAQTVQQATENVDRAINQTRADLFDGSPKSPSQLLALFRFPKPQAVELARAREIYEQALELIKEYLNKGMKLDQSQMRADVQYSSLLSVSHLQMLMEMTGCTPGQFTDSCTDMCLHSKYRSYDGQCNNIEHPMWGVSLMPFLRLMPAIYENGFNHPVGWDPDKLYYGYLKPNPRDVSLQVVTTKEVTPDPKFTAMLMQWGQWVDHDLDFAVGATSRDIFASGFPCNDTCDHIAPCFNIPLPSADPRRHPAAFCMEFERSSAACGSGQTSVIFQRVTPREQLSQITSFLDASQVYGSSEQETLDLRDLFSDHGLLRFDIVSHSQKPYLPFNRDAPMDCRRNETQEHPIRCFLAGDYRANEQLGLLSMHTLWLREHNRIASKLLVLNPHWDGERIFQETRKIVGGMMQHITYQHWLPHILGEEGMKLVGEYKGYSATVNPTVSNVFATAAFRFGHGLINPTLYRYDQQFQPIPTGHLPLHQAFFSPERLLTEGGIDPLLRGLFASRMKEPRSDQLVNEQLTEHLFDKAHSIALDLAALNIQRGRDHALPSYIDWRKWCNLSVPVQWDDLDYDIPDAGIRSRLSNLYGHPGNLDLWVGGMLERTIAGSRVGPTFACIIADQFRRTRDGDRFWYESPGVFSSLQLAEIRKTSLASVLCLNGDNIDRVQNDAFVYPGGMNPTLYGTCSDITTINLNMWQSCCDESCSLHNYLDDGIEDLDESRQSTKRKRRAIGETASEQHEHTMVNNRLAELETVVASMRYHIDKLEDGMKRGDCKDARKIWRKSEESWAVDACTRCECKDGQIWCSTKSCPQLRCKQYTKLPFVCCPVCINKF